MGLLPDRKALVAEMLKITNVAPCLEQQGPWVGTAQRSKG